MKKILFAICMFAVVNTFANVPPVEVSEKVLKAFKETFHGAKQVLWFENENGYEVYFKTEEVNSKVWYDKEGNITMSRRYYNEHELPAYIYSQLKKKFAGKDIFGVTEITDDSGVAYYIKLEDDKSWYTVKSDGCARFEVVEKYKKA